MIALMVLIHGALFGFLYVGALRILSPVTLLDLIEGIPVGAHAQSYDRRIIFLQQ